MSETLKAITANDLFTGEVIFASREATSGTINWTSELDEAELFEDPAVADAMLQKAKLQTETVVEPYVIDLVMVEGMSVPTSYRERIRTLGPTIHPDMGKQARGGDMILILQKARGAARSSGRLGLIQR